MKELTWEQRMSKRAKERADAKWRDERDAAEQEHLETEAQWLATCLKTMTPERARETLDAESFPCACTGGPSCCAIRFRAAQQVLGTSEGI